LENEIESRPRYQEIQGKYFFSDGMELTFKLNLKTVQTAKTDTITRNKNAER